MLKQASEESSESFTGSPDYRWSINKQPFSTTAISEALFRLYPSLIPKDDPEWFCNKAQLQYQNICVPWKKIRYDLKIFCYDYADVCEVPNHNGGNIFDDGRPFGHGQKQTDGTVGVGNSFALGLGPVPGFEVVASQGVDVGPVPGLDEIGGFVLNKGSELGILGERIGRGPARSIDGLAHGYSTFDPYSFTQRQTADLQQNLFRSLGLGNLPALGNLFGKSSPRAPQKPKVQGYEPGYGAVNKNALIATGKTDTDEVVLPAVIGDVQMSKGFGLGIG